MYTVYGIKNCNTVKNALNYLNDKGIAYVFHDYKKQGVTRAKLEQWLSQYTWEELVNKKGTTWKQIPDDSKPTNIEEAIIIMMEKNSIIKRPIVEDGSIKAMGFDESVYKKL